MALPNEKKTWLRSWPDFALFLAALVFCAYSARAISKTPAPIPQKKSPLSRSLASVSVEQGATERSTRTLDLLCLDESPARMTTEAGLLRMKAEACGGKILRAMNLTTGETLMLFERNNNVTTHYFPLKAGVNKILVEWKASKKSAKMLEVEKN